MIESQPPVHLVVPGALDRFYKIARGCSAQTQNHWSEFTLCAVSWHRSPKWTFHARGHCTAADHVVNMSSTHCTSTSSQPSHTRLVLRVRCASAVDLRCTYKHHPARCHSTTGFESGGLSCGCTSILAAKLYFTNRTLAPLKASGSISKANASLCKHHALHRALTLFRTTTQCCNAIFTSHPTKPCQTHPTSPTPPPPKPITPLTINARNVVQGCQSTVGGQATTHCNNGGGQRKDFQLAHCESGQGSLSVKSLVIILSAPRGNG